MSVTTSSASGVDVSSTGIRGLDVLVHRIVDRDDLASLTRDGDVVLGCEVVIPGVENYRVREEAVYRRGRGLGESRSCALSVFLLKS